MMFRVLIVDDEPITRQGLVMLIPWGSYGFEVVGTAANGNEAIEKYSSLSPNLMIIDIRMPGMSGIELIERIRVSDSSVQFLILSGHAEFEYAKKAISNNVKGYLLKPVDEDELIRYLQEINTKLVEALEYNHIKVKKDEENKERIIHFALEGERIDEFEYCSDHFLEWNKYRVLLISVDEQSNSDLMNLKNSLREFFEEGNTGTVFIYNSYIGILLNSDHEFSGQFDHLYKNLQKVFHNNYTHFTAAISNPFDKITDIFAYYESTSRLINHQFFFDEGYLLNESSEPAIKVEIQDSQYEVEQFKMTSVVDKLLFAMEIGDLSAIERICNEIAIRMIDENYSENIIKKNFIQIISSLLNKLMYEYQDIRETLSNVFSRVFEIENQPKIRALLSFVNSLLAEILEKMDVKNTDVLVKKMINLIERNYDKNIKLETLSKVLNYNRAYLGKLFKDYTGEHFNTYLDKVRIDKAKNLLLQGLKVYQVAERIGFSNVDYFHSKFRKYEGMSPSTYRKSKMMN